MSEIAQGQVGPEVKYDVSFSGLALKAKIDRVGGMGDMESLAISIPAEMVLKALFEKLPQGTIEKQIEDALLAGLKLIPA